MWLYDHWNEMENFFTAHVNTHHPALPGYHSAPGDCAAEIQGY